MKYPSRNCMWNLLEHEAVLLPISIILVRSRRGTRNEGMMGLLRATADHLGLDRDILV